MRSLPTAWISAPASSEATPGQYRVAKKSFELAAVAPTGSGNTDEFFPALRSVGVTCYVRRTLT